MSENSLKVSVGFGGDDDNDRDNKKFLETENQLKEGEEFLFDSDYDRGDNKKNSAERFNQLEENEEILFDSGDTKKFTKDTNIDEFYNQIKNLEIPNGLASFLEIKDDLTEKINQIILGMHSFIEKHGIQEIGVNIISEFLGKVYNFFDCCFWFLMVLKTSRPLLDQRILECLYQILVHLSNRNMIILSKRLRIV